MALPAGRAPAAATGRITRTEQGGSLPFEQLLRYAHQLLAQWGANLPPSKVTRLCRTYSQTSGRIGFEQYLFSNADFSELQRVRRRNAFGVLDPTGEQAAHQVDRQRGVA